jgi:DNA invertase Pin-like site-specific DNA recombinase
MIPTQESLRAAIYVRTATVAQDDEDRLERQVIACRRLADSRGANVVAEYRDIGSGLASVQSGLQDLIAAAARHEVDVVLCEAPDRMARDLTTRRAVEEQLRHHGVTVHCASDGDATGTVRRVIEGALLRREGQEDSTW